MLYILGNFVCSIVFQLSNYCKEGSVNRFYLHLTSLKAMQQRFISSQCNTSLLLSSNRRNKNSWRISKLNMYTSKHIFISPNKPTLRFISTLWHLLLTQHKDRFYSDYIFIQKFTFLSLKVLAGIKLYMLPRSVPSPS